MSSVVDQYWHVSWASEEGQHPDQPIIDLPAATATMEEGDVRAPLMVPGVPALASATRSIEELAMIAAYRRASANLTA